MRRIATIIERIGKSVLLIATRFNIAIYVAIVSVISINTIIAHDNTFPKRVDLL